jgi:hypothetical protein
MPGWGHWKLKPRVQLLVYIFGQTAVKYLLDWLAQLWCRADLTERVLWPADCVFKVEGRGFRVSWCP